MPLFPYVLTLRHHRRRTHKRRWECLGLVCAAQLPRGHVPVALTSSPGAASGPRIACPRPARARRGRNRALSHRGDLQQLQSGEDTIQTGPVGGCQPTGTTKGKQAGGPCECLLSCRPCYPAQPRRLLLLSFKKQRAAGGPYMDLERLDARTVGCTRLLIIISLQVHGIECPRSGG